MSESITIYTVISTCNDGTAEHYTAEVYAGIDKQKAIQIASEGGIFVGNCDKWNTVRTWRNGVEVMTPLCYNRD